MASMVFDKKRRNGLQLDKRDHFNYYSLFVLKVQLLFFFTFCCSLAQIYGSGISDHLFQRVFFKNSLEDILIT